MTNQDHSNSPHISVLLKEVLAVLNPVDGDVIVDGTFGAGGYSRAILESADCKVYGIDRDPRAIAIAREMEKEFEGRLKVLEGCYSDMVTLLADAGIEAVDGVALDIGVSSMQIDEAERGFSFMSDGPLDRRMAQSGQSAADVVNTYEEEALADIFYQYGEERKSRPIARAIVKAREEEPIERTSQLANIVAGAIGFFRKKGAKTIHPAPRVFQALRIYVNDELGELERGLDAAEKLLRPGGRLAVVSFHSLEDRIVKNYLIEKSGTAARGSRHLPDQGQVGPDPVFKLIKKGAIKPSKDEESSNPRARSSRLRGGVKVSQSSDKGRED